MVSIWHDGFGIDGDVRFWIVEMDGACAGGGMGKVWRAPGACPAAMQPFLLGCLLFMVFNPKEKSGGVESMSLGVYAV